ncbi:MAG: GTPase HflX, partial [Sedimentisphaerales bacterium]
MRENIAVKREKAILVGALAKNTYADNLAELAALAESAGAIIVDKLQQKIIRVHPATYIGSGKADMIRQRAIRTGAEVIIFDNDLSPGQIRNLEEIIQVKVIDRSELILDIFASR